MHAEDIKAAIRKTGITLKALAVAGGLSESAVRKALAVPSPRAEKLIADRLNKSLHEIWPDRYDRRGGRKFTKVKSTPQNDMTHRQMCEAR